MRAGYVAVSDTAALAHILSRLGCDTFYTPDEECDDLISSFCFLNQETIRTIISDDKDFFQLLTDPRITIFRPSGKQGFRFLDSEASTKYWGTMNGGKHPEIPPSNVRMFKSLCGDSSDDISGVHLLRKKIAANVCHLSTVDDVLASGFPGFSASEKSKTLESIERLKRNFELVGMRTDIQVSDTKFGPSRDQDLAKEILSEDLGVYVDTLPFSRIRKTPQLMQPLGPPEWLDI